MDYKVFHIKMFKFIKTKPIQHVLSKPKRSKNERLNNNRMYTMFSHKLSLTRTLSIYILC